MPHFPDTPVGSHAWNSALSLAREYSCHTFEPWLRDSQLQCVRTDPRLGAHLRLLHLGLPTRIDPFDPSDVTNVVELGWAQLGDGLLSPIRRFSTFRGLTAAADPENGRQESEIYLGEDGLKFTSLVLDSRPTGVVMDIGSGTGIASAAAAIFADEVHAYDVVPRASDATALTAELCGVSDRVMAHCADLDEIQIPSRVDYVIANLPGLPVPDEVKYSVAGNGGPDGRDLIREMWTKFARSLRTGEPRSLIMRFESTTQDGIIAAFPELQEIFGNRCDASLTVDSQVSLALRHLATIANARAINPELDQAKLEHIFFPDGIDSSSTFVTANLVLRYPGSGAFHTCSPPATSALSESPLTPSLSSRDSFANTIAPASVWPIRVPDELELVGGDRLMAEVFARRDEIADRLAQGESSWSVGEKLSTTVNCSQEFSTVPKAVAVAVFAESLLSRCR